MKTLKLKMEIRDSEGKVKGSKTGTATELSKEAEQILALDLLCPGDWFYFCKITA